MTAFDWVSPYDPNDSRGGWKSMQYYFLRALESRIGPANRFTSIDIPEEIISKWISRIKKKIYLPRNYSYYSQTRLNAFARRVHQQFGDNYRKPVVFFGTLPFVSCKPAAPYFIYTDGAFFIHYWEYNQDHSHDKSDIDRICNAEAEFMRHAACVWCSSQWVVDRVTSEYNLKPGKAVFVGTGPGNVPPPIESICYDNYLVMIASDFKRKGGKLAVEAVALARKMGVEVNIKFIGEQPPQEVLALPFVEWCGWLDLRQDSDRRRFADVMSLAGALILLSRSDLTPLAIPEAASYGKATLATAVGGIAEMIINCKTGWLVSAESTSAEIGKCIAQIFKFPEALTKTGSRANEFCLKNWSWDSVAERAINTINI